MTEEQKETTPRGLWPRLLEAQREVGSVGKDGRNTHQNYDYVRAEDVIRAGKKALNDAGLVAFVQLAGRETIEGTTSSNKRSLFVTQSGELVVRDVETGEEARFPFVGTGTDSPGDKAVYKAITGGTKYALQAALQIAFGDDPEDHSMPGSQGASDQPGRLTLPAWAEPYSGEKLVPAISYLLDPANPADGKAEALELVEKFKAEAMADHVPNLAAMCVMYTAAAVKRRIDAGEPPAADEPAEPAEPEPDTEGPSGADEDPEIKF